MDSNMPIAVIGMSCRFAGGVKNPEDLWQLCADGRTAWSEIPASRFNVDGVSHPNPQKLNTANVIGGHFLQDDIAAFDASFFNLTAEAAKVLDPQFRLQLESTYEALENAGITIQDVAGSNTSVFAGSFFRDYSDAHARDPEALPRFLLLGVGAAMASNRISHFYDLRGASMTLDTGCSTTLTALHQACQSLRTGESDMSVVGGANVLLNPDNFEIMTSVGFLGRTGRSFAFDSRAEGYGRGEGSATIVIKRLDDAIRDGDPVRAIIRASGVNQDGKTETITTPSQAAQEQLIRACYKKARLDPAHTDYFEAHGTGTTTGDPIEARAISSAFKERRQHGQPVRLGSVKTNVGHTETASGLASIIKAALMLEKGLIPPIAGFEKPNEKIDLDALHLDVPRKLENWPEDSGYQRASINNFGYGGTNAHVIMESYESFLKTSMPKGHISTSNGANGHANTNGASNGLATDSARIVMLSAKDEHACQTMISNLAEYVSSKSTGNQEKDSALFARLAYTLSQRRSLFSWIATTSAQSLTDLSKALTTPRMKPARREETAPRLGFVFTGQGAQWFAMGRELIEAYPVYRDTILEAEGYLKGLGAEWSLLDELLQDETTSRVNDTELSTPLCVALQVALMRLLLSWGISPVAVTSHSSGEIAAACAVGAISLHSTMAIVLSRGELAGALTKFVDGPSKGGMMAVGIGAEESEKYLARVTAGRVVIACLNSPVSTTISGDVTGLIELEEILKADNIFARRLKVDAAWHSHHVQVIAKPYRQYLEKYMKPLDGSLDDVIFSSPTTGKRMSSFADLGRPQHWVDSLVSPVQFIEAFRNMCFEEDGTALVDAVVEVGPHGALSAPINNIVDMLPEFAGGDNKKVSYNTCLIRKNNAVATMHALVVDLVRMGYPVHMEAVNFPRGRHDVPLLTDLPAYPWNHTVKHWSEARVNKSFRERRDTPHDLLGSSALDSNPLTPSWRNVLRVSDLPWVREHIIQANFVYPGAGYLCMAIEGACAQHNKDHEKDQQQIKGYQLRNIDIQSALVVPDTAEGIEVHLTLHPSDPKNISAIGWQEFRICSVTADNVWSEHCRGQIKIDIQPRQHVGAGVLKQDVDYRIRIDPKDIYTGLRAAGINHGPIFQNLRNIRAREKESVSVFTIADTAAIMPYKEQHAHVIHPTTLDTIFQAAYTALDGAGSRAQETAQIPRSIKHIWVAHDIPSTPGHDFNALTTLSHASKQSFETNITVTNAVDDDVDAAPILTVEGFLCQSIGNVQQTDHNDSTREKFITPVWGPDITFLKLAALQTELSRPIDPKESETLVDLRHLIIYYIIKAIGQVTTPIEKLEPHIAKYYAWMKKTFLAAAHNKLAPNSIDWVSSRFEEGIDALEAKVRSASVNGELVTQVGPHLGAIMRGDKSVSDVLDSEDFPERYYQDGLKVNHSMAQVATLVSHIVHKNPRARILEIGAGSGTATMAILETLGTDNPKAAVYEYTDVSPNFFPAAKEKFTSWESLVSYRKLDIEQDPIKQDYKEGTYDLIIASRVLSSTKSMERTMAHVRKLLKPDGAGRLILVEPTQDQTDVHFVFSLLPEWWSSEEQDRKLNPSLSVGLWNSVLQSAGFTGVDLEVRDAEDEELYSLSTIMSSTVPAAPKVTSNVVIVAPAIKSVLYTQWLQSLKASIRGFTGAEPSVESIADVQGDGAKTFLFLAELVAPILPTLDETQFKAIRAICTQSKGVLWVTRGGSMDCSDPHLGLSIGFLRSLRNEYGGKRLVSLDLDPKSALWSTGSAGTVAEVFGKAFDDSVAGVGANNTIDFEFAERAGVVSILRYRKDTVLNKSLFPDASDVPTPELKAFEQHDRPLRLFVQTPGLLDTLVWDDDPTANVELDPESIEVAPRAFGLNFRDVMVAMGQLQSDIMGFECAGHITRVGSAVKGFQPGDRVAMLLRGHYGNLARVHWTSVVHIPDDMTFEVAASMPVSYCTAYIAVYLQARLKKGETILIHAATGAFGQAALVLAKDIGADIYVTVGTPAKREFIMKHYGVAPERIFNSRDISFKADVLRATNGRGVDVVLNSLAGLLLQESFNCLAPFGRFVEIGKRDFELNSQLAMHAFTRVATFTSVELPAFSEAKKAENYELFKEVIRLAGEKVIVPVEPITVFPVSELDRTYRLMQAGKHMGKIVISMKPDELIPILPQKKQVKLRSNGTYLVVGGLGGIGRSVCHWLVAHGARNIAIISRRKDARKSGSALIFELEKLGCRVEVVTCDIVVEAEVAAAVKICAEDLKMPSIRGVIQAAMVLQDSIMENMTLDDYAAGVRPKVAGTWNLHTQTLSQPLDFFVMLSSLVGQTGNASQSAYSAGGAFQDALARHRVSQGLPAVAIDLGQVKSVGYLAETDKSMADRLLKLGFSLLGEEDVLAALGAAVLAPHAGLLIMGLNVGGGSHWDDAPFLARDARFGGLRFREDASASNKGASKAGLSDLAGKIASAGALDEAAAAVVEVIVSKLVDIFMMPKDEITPSKPLSAYGVDSLVAVELRNMLAIQAASDVTIFDIMQTASISALATIVANKSSHLDASVVGA
ncbi:hypothetical protein M406DRAFT_245563 [Cryphonectria parasitica EP155]|uniref:Carrier domain-containing protein n=1 Tax=Cryphonectria parasitica (strain ATCC 38755 / EP155) TaxID=660469 RepID=A0A9P4YD45_CRYP1|nr:uncharacterized protein M406DRAFT_245563 [Cryphonectria parasitica EP155]KAF3771163.1 hypothetical protein M406DRAFT_245563 [Cryphonectria parasitica EP155]